MADEFPKSFKDPVYASLDTATEKKLGLPVGLLASIRLHGERSNADQVSEASARSPYQFIPSTRKALIDKYGIDPLLSPQNASEAAGLLLKEGLGRNGGDPVLAAGEYHAGPDRSGWGPRTKAYMNRVAVGLQGAKTSALENDFAKFMEANPAVPAGRSSAATPAPAAAPAGKTDALDAGFGQWLAQKEAPQGADAIPGQAPGVAPAPDGTVPQGPQPDPTIGQRLVGAGEAAANVVTGLTGGTVGMAGGTAAGMADAILSGQFGTPEAARMIEQRAAKGAEALTYAPRTASGQSQAAVIGEGLQAAIPVMPLAGELAGVARAASALKPTAQAVPAIARNTVGNAASAVAEGAGSMRDALSGQVNSLLGREAPKPTPGTMGSAGAAGVDMATQRRMAAQELPVPLELTEGQATRNFSQQRFEQETAKSPTAGEPLRERFAEQRQNFARNFDAMIDQTGAVEPTLRGAGIAVDSALKADVAKWKTEIRAKYAEARKAGETAAPVDSGGIIEALNRMTSAESTAPVISAAKAEIQRLGGASRDGNGGLVAGQLTVDGAEQLRKFVGSVTGHDPVNQKFAGDIKRAIDATTENAGGDLYRAARRAREQYARRFEDNAVIKQLLSEKRGTADRQVALEDVFKKSVLDGSLDDIRTVRKVLQTAGEEGRQAWKELQGQTVNHIREQAMKSAVRDDRGNVVISADAINRVITALERDGKLDFVFGKKGAETMRTLNDVAKHVYTAPPGTVNTSNTASVLLAALDMGISGASGMPLPVTSGLRMVVNNVKDRRIRARVAQALGKTEQRAKVRASAERAVAAKKKTIH